MVAKRALNVASAILALLIMALLVWEASDAAFSASTDGESGTVSAVEITLDDATGWTVSPPFDAVLFPGDSYFDCVEVTFGSNPGTWTPSLDPVRLYASATAGDTGTFDIAVDEVTSCVDAATEAGTSVYASGPISGLTTNYATGSVGTWVPSGDGDSQLYRVTVTLDASATDAVQGDTADFTLVWEVRTN